MDDVLGQVHVIKKDRTDRQKRVAHFYPALRVSEHSFIRSTVSLRSTTFCHHPQSLAGGPARPPPGREGVRQEGLAAQVSDGISIAQPMKTAKHQAITLATNTKTPNNPFAI